MTGVLTMGREAADEGCLHCGAPVSAREDFCCDGCRTVFGFLHDSGLDGYYDLRRTDEAAPARLGRDPMNHLDSPASRERYVSGEGVMSFHLAGLHCPACLWLVEKLPEVCPGVDESRLDFGRHVVRVRVAADGSFAAAAETLRRMGFEPSPVAGDDELGRHEMRRRRTNLIRLGVAGFCAGNIMLLSSAVYSGAGGAFARLFNVLGAALFVPVLGYAALPFFRGVVSSLRAGRASIDLPVVTALLAGTVLSTVSLLRGDGPLYFDTLAVLVFLLLVARWFLDVVRGRIASGEAARGLLDRVPVKRLEPAAADVYGADLAVGDLVEVATDRLLPTDGELVDDRALLDLASLTGESRPLEVQAGEAVLAGSRIVDGPVRYRVRASVSESRLGRLLDGLETGSTGDRTATVVDRWGQSFTLVVCVTAVVVALLSFTPVLGLGHEGLVRALALVIVACPCAMAFGQPLTLARVIGAGVGRGILIRDPAVLERLSGIRTVHLDKTGTLTSGELSVTAVEPRDPTDEEMSLIAALEADSRHPVGRALMRYAAGAAAVRIEDWRETPGRGVEGVHDGHLCRIGPVGGGSRSGLTRDGELLLTFRIDDPPRDGARADVGALADRGLEIQVLSGDARETVDELGDDMGIDPGNRHGECLPEDKVRRVAGGDSMMVGDGVNDAPALQAAAIGVAVRGGLVENLRVADVALVRPGIGAVDDLFVLGEESRRMVSRSLGFSVAYNASFGAAALAGWVSPLVAAVVMPLSSLTVIGMVLAGTRRLRRWS